MLDPLVDALLRWTDTHEGDDALYATDIEDLWFFRTDVSSSPSHAVYNASVCLVVQGAKEVAVGDRLLRYRAGELLVVGVDLPLTSRIVEATPERPYLAIALDLDPALVFEIAQGMGHPMKSLGQEAPAVFVSRLDDSARGAMERLVGLLDTPTAIPALYRAIAREVYYWLLQGPDGEALAQLAVPRGHTRRIARAVQVMKQRFPNPLRVADLAEAANLSASRFHIHFKAATGMTPIQYYKRLRLLEARQLLLTEGLAAQDAAFEVGYESPSQFSREYARTFGAPPQRDVAETRQA